MVSFILRSKNYNFIFITALTFVLLLSASAVAKPEYTDPPSIEYVTHYLNSDLTVTFEYRLTSGDKPELKQWELYSSCFTSRKIIKVSEQFSVNPVKNYMRFDTKYDAGESRMVEITLQLDYYSMTIAPIDYILYWPSGPEVAGEVLGPVCAPDFVVPEGPLGTLGVIIPFATAIGLVYAFGKKKILI